MKGTLSSLLLAGCLLIVSGAQAQESRPSAGNAQQSETWQQRYDDALAQHLRGVAASGEPRDLYIAALLWPAQLQGQQEPKQWLAAAVRARPRDLLVARYEAEGCWNASASCDPAGAVAFLLKEAPDNAYVQLLAMAVAERNHDEDQVERAWRAAVDADRYDPLLLTASQAIAQAVDGIPVPPLSAVDAKVMGVAPDKVQQFPLVAAWAVVAGLSPSVAPVARRCSPEAAAHQDARLDDCKSIFALMARDTSSLIGQLQGIAMMVRLTRGTPQSLAWEEERRQLQWVMQQSVRARTEVGISDMEWSQLALNDGERSASETMLAAARLPISAPAGWVPESSVIVERQNARR